MLGWYPKPPYGALFETTIHEQSRRSFLPRFRAAFLLVLLVWGQSACSQATNPSITVEAGVPAMTVNALLFGHNVFFSGNVGGMWNTKINDLDPKVSSLVKSLSPTIIRFPGGSFSDTYLWEDGIGHRTTLPVTRTASSIVLDAAPNWGTVRKACFIDSMGGQFGDPFGFARLKGNRLEGVSGIHASHPAGAEVRPGAREGQPDWASNTYGIDEHMKFVNSIGSQAILTVNYGTGLDKLGKISTAASLSQRVMRAAAWVAYLNGSPDDPRPIGVDEEGNDWKTVGYWAQKRSDRGHPDPYGVTYWEIGNEVYGDWEAGFTTVRKYAKDFTVFAKTMKTIDPSIKAGAVGLSDPHRRGDADSLDEWNAKLVSIAGAYIDFLVLHLYYPSASRAQVSYASTTWLTAVMAAAQQAVFDLREIRAVIAANRSRAEQVELVVTEYGIWPADSTDARDFSNLARALYDADLLMTLLQHGAELGVTLATAWNLHGDIETAAIGYDWDTGTRRLRPNYHAFQLLRSSLKPKQLSTTVRSPSFRTSRVGNVARRSGIPFLNAVASLDVNNGKLNLLVLNRSLTDAISTTIRLNGFLPASTAQVRTLKGPSVRAHNEDVSTTVGIVISNLAQASSSFAYTFPPYSLTSIEFSP